MDYCTLVTCTPYGINSHRLLVRGHRIRNAEVASAMRITGEAIQVKDPLVAAFLAVPLLFLVLLALFIYEPRRPEDADSSIFEELVELEIDYLDIDYDMNDLRRLAAMEQPRRRVLRGKRRGYASLFGRDKTPDGESAPPPEETPSAEPQNAVDAPSETPERADTLPMEGSGAAPDMHFEPDASEPPENADPPGIQTGGKASESRENADAPDSGASSEPPEGDGAPGAETEDPGMPPDTK